MDDAESEIARQLGGGVKSQGVRIALRAAKMLGIAETLAASAAYPGGGCESAQSPTPLTEHPNDD